MAEGVYAQSASINVECIAKGEGEVLLANANIIHKGRKLTLASLERDRKKYNWNTFFNLKNVFSYQHIVYFLMSSLDMGVVIETMGYIIYGFMVLNILEAVIF